MHVGRRLRNGSVRTTCSGDNLPPDEFGYVGNNGVSDPSHSVHLVGNPMCHSSHVGFSGPMRTTVRATAVTRSSPPDLARETRLKSGPEALAFAVGHNEQPCPCVWGTHAARRDNRPFRIEPALGQVPENSVEAKTEMPWDVLQEREAGS
jgi:hypothetical protein